MASKWQAKATILEFLTGSSAAGNIAILAAGVTPAHIVSAKSVLSSNGDPAPAACFTALGAGVTGESWADLVSDMTAALTSPTSYGSAVSFATYIPVGTTTGSLITTGSTWVPFVTAGACGQKFLLENKCNTGEFASVRIRAGAKNTTASGDGGSSIGTTTAIDASASARQAEYGVLKAVNAVAQPNAYAQTTDSSNIVTALYGRIDATAASVGRRWVMWIDTHETVRSDESDYMVRISHNGTVAMDGAFTIYAGGRLPVLFNFEDVGAGTPVKDSDDSLTTQSGSIAVQTPAGTKYIALYNQ